MSTHYVTYQAFEHKMKDLKEMKKQYASKENVKADLSELKYDLLKWMVGCTVGGILAVLGIIAPLYINLDNRMYRLYTELYDLKLQVNTVDKKVDSIDKRIDSMDKRMDSMDKRMDSMEKNIADIHNFLIKR